MGDPEYDAENRLRRGRRWFVVVTLALTSTLVAGGAWVHAQVPPVAHLSATPAASAVPATAIDAHAELVTNRLAQASGQSLQALAEQAPSPVANPLESDPDLVGSAQAASEGYAKTLAELSKAEQAAAEQLADSEQGGAVAESERAKASAELAAAEAATAGEIDAAIQAAIDAARAQSTSMLPLGGGFTGTTGGSAVVPSGRSTNTAAVLALVRKYFPADEVGNAMAVSRCESGHANRVSKQNSNGTRDFGVFQINDGGTMQAALRRIGVSFSGTSEAQDRALDPELNVRMARAIWDSRGWQPWTCAANLKVVAGLYQRTPGPMAGKYDEYGRAR